MWVKKITSPKSKGEKKISKLIHLTKIQREKYVSKKYLTKI